MTKGICSFGHSQYCRTGIFFEKKVLRGVIKDQRPIDATVSDELLRYLSVLRLLEDPDRQTC